MRIIAGEHRGRKLLDPADDATRPVTDRVKQSLFDVVRGRLPEARVFDVFAGTGSFGLESLSRGAKHATFFERHKPAVERLRRNIDTLGVAAATGVITADIFKFFQDAALPPADVVFLDPPYRYLNDKPDELRALIATLSGRHLAPGGLIVLRHDAKDDIDLPPETCGVAESDRRRWGSMTVRFLEPAS